MLGPLFESLSAARIAPPVVVGGSVVTPNDARMLLERGVAAAFGPTAGSSEIVETVTRLARGE